MLSRWKGMETRQKDYTSGTGTLFGYAFPLEGNGNLQIPSTSGPAIISFGYAFPFEGNGNPILV